MITAQDINGVIFSQLRINSQVMLIPPGYDNTSDPIEMLILNRIIDHCIYVFNKIKIYTIKKNTNDYIHSGFTTTNHIQCYLLLDKKLNLVVPIDYSNLNDIEPQELNKYNSIIGILDNEKTYIQSLTTKLSRVNHVYYLFGFNLDNIKLIVDFKNRFFTNTMVWNNEIRLVLYNKAMRIPIYCKCNIKDLHMKLTNIFNNVNDIQTLDKLLLTYQYSESLVEDVRPAMNELVQHYCNPINPLNDLKIDDHLITRFFDPIYVKGDLKVYCENFNTCQDFTSTEPIDKHNTSYRIIKELIEYYKLPRRYEISVFGEIRDGCKVIYRDSGGILFFNGAAFVYIEGYWLPANKDEYREIKERQKIYNLLNNL